MTYIVSRGALNSTHSLTHLQQRRVHKELRGSRATQKFAHGPCGGPCPCQGPSSVLSWIKLGKGQKGRKGGMAKLEERIKEKDRLG